MPKYFEFEVSLNDIKPRIWRRFLLHEKATFADLHQAIQDSLGWDGGHLWTFIQPGRQHVPIAGPVPDDDEDDDFGSDTPDAYKVKVSDYFTGPPARKQGVYIYDFGDDWQHQVRLRREVSDPQKFHRRLLAGSRACPLEDCGGIPGYEHMVEFLKTGKDPYGEDPEELREWIGDWRPDDFDLERTKRDFDR